jgi:hypothetical protein
VSAFEKYLLSLPRHEAVFHMVECLSSGGEMAWDLMNKINGDWKCRPEDLPALICETLDTLEKQ